MPGMTPNFSIRYPCAGETIDPTVFQDFADDVDAALLAVETMSADVLLRPRGASETDMAGTSCAAGATTTMNFTSVEFNSGLTPIAGGYTVPAGVWMAAAEFAPVNSATTVSSFSAILLLGATIQYQRRLGYPLVGPDTDAHFQNVSGLIYTAAPANITAAWNWSGTGGPMFVFSRIFISKIADV